MDGLEAPLSTPPSNEEPFRLVRLVKGDTGLDFSIKGGKDYNIPIVISRVFAGGAAEKLGTIHSGDEIGKVNGTNMQGLTHTEAVQILKMAGAVVDLELRSNPEMRAELERAARNNEEKKRAEAMKSAQLAQARAAAAAAAAAAPAPAPAPAPVAAPVVVASAAAAMPPPATAPPAGAGTSTGSDNVPAYVAPPEMTQLATSTSLEMFSTTLPHAPAARTTSGRSMQGRTPRYEMEPGGSQKIAQEEERLRGQLGAFPDGWEVRKDAKTGRLYYLDHHKHTTSWVDPRIKGLRKAHIDECVGDEIPIGWQRWADENGFVYYIDHSHGRTVWEHPRKIREREQIAEIRQFITQTKIKVADKRRALEVRRGEVLTMQTRLSKLRSKKMSLFNSAGGGAAGDQSIGEIEATISQDTSNLRLAEEEVAALERSTNALEHRLADLLYTTDLMEGDIEEEMYEDMSLSVAAKEEQLRSSRRHLRHGDRERVEIEQEVENLRAEITGDPAIDVKPFVRSSAALQKAAVERKLTKEQDVRGTPVEVQLERLLLKYELDLLDRNKQDLNTYRQRILLEKRHIIRLQTENPGLEVVVPDWVLDRPWVKPWLDGDSLEQASASELDEYRIKGTTPDRLPFSEKLLKLKLMDS